MAVHVEDHASSEALLTRKRRRLLSGTDSAARLCLVALLASLPALAQLQPERVTCPKQKFKAVSLRSKFLHSSRQKVSRIPAS